MIKISFLLLCALGLTMLLSACGGWQLRGSDALYDANLMAYVDMGRSTPLGNALQPLSEKEGLLSLQMQKVPKS